MLAWTSIGIVHRRILDESAQAAICEEMMPFRPGELYNIALLVRLLCVCARTTI
jgi:hypothetical protein